MEPEIAAFQRTPPSDSGTLAIVRSVSPAALVWPTPRSANFKQAYIERPPVRTSKPLGPAGFHYCRHCRHSLSNPQSQNGAQVSTLETHLTAAVKSTPPRIQPDHDARILLATTSAVILSAIDSILPNPRFIQAASRRNAKKLFKKKRGIPCALLAIW
jgi:hypothetical protein